MLSASRLVPLCAGLALGSAATWTLLNLHSPPPASTAALPLPGSSRPAAFPAPPPPPPRLAGTKATTALDAYLALPPLSDKAPAAELVARTGELRVLLTRLPVSLFERLLSALASRTGSAEARLRLLAFEVWTEHDAPAAARWAVALVPGESIDAPTRARYATTAALAWGETTFDPAYAWASTLPDTKLGADLARQLLAQLAATDPTRALALARAAGDEFFKASQQALFTAWAAKDPAAALQALGPGLLENPTIPEPLFAALGQWFARDSESAFAWIIAQPPGNNDPRDQNDFFYSAFSRLGSDPTTARTGADLLLAHPELTAQPIALILLTGSWTRQNPNSALAWLDRIPDAETRTQLIDSMIRVRGTYDLKIEDSLAFAQRLPASPDRDEKISRQINGWATTDPDAALAWLAAHDSPGLASVAAGVQGTLLARLAETDPAAALARWKSLPAGLEQSVAAGPLANAWAKTDPAAASVWLNGQLPSFPSATQRGEAIRSLAWTWAQTDTAAAARWMTDQLATLPAAPDASGIDQARQATYPHILTQLGSSDPHVVLKLAATTTDPSLQRAIYDTLTYDRYLDFRGNITEPTLSFASRAELVSNIPDESNRTPVLTNLLSNWLRQDFESARAWIESHDAVSPDLAAQLITKADPAAP
jgi:hypothetical protein